MSDNPAPFKVGDKVKSRGGVYPAERIVTSLFQVQGIWWMVYLLNNKLPYMVPCAGFELVPDPMVARREAYLAWASLAWPLGAGAYPSHFQLVREGKQDGTVNSYYDAIVATKHLFV